jgi:hypothetical protein
MNNKKVGHVNIGKTEHKLKDQTYAPEMGGINHPPTAGVLGPI